MSSTHSDDEYLFVPMRESFEESPIRGGRGAQDGECAWAGHDWAPAGGGLLICMRCEAERWEA